VKADVGASRVASLVPQVAYFYHRAYLPDNRIGLMKNPLEWVLRNHENKQLLCKNCNFGCPIWVSMVYRRRGGELFPREKMGNSDREMVG
jgi:hypothetical protein